MMTHSITVAKNVNKYIMCESALEVAGTFVIGWCWGEAFSLVGFSRRVTPLADVCSEDIIRRTKGYHPAKMSHYYDAK